MKTFERPVLSLRTVRLAATDDMMREINELSRDPLAAGDVIVHGMEFMNDRPMHEDPWFIRKFDARAVQQAQEMVRAKPMIANHDTFSAGALPLARIFRPDGVNTDAAGVTTGRALFFLLNDAEGQAIDRKIRGGIITEVSPTVMVDRIYCSICGEDDLDCEHCPGELYDGKKCYATMSDIADLWEVSFVWAGRQKGTAFYEAASRSFAEASGRQDMDSWMKGVKLAREGKQPKVETPAATGWQFMDSTQA